MKNIMSKTNKSFSGKGFWAWGIGAVSAGVLIGIGILFWYTPNAYQPVLSQEEEQKSIYLTHELGPQFYNEVQKCKPFELVITQPGINEIISQEFQTQDFGDVSFSNPQVIFSDQSILLMGTLTYEGVSSVISITAFPKMRQDSNVNLNIQSVRMGMIPVKTLVTKLAQKVFDANRDSFEDDPKAEETVQAIILNQPFDPTFLFPAVQDDYWVRVSEFSVNPGLLTLTLHPKED